jgi:hypothetical protein
MNIDILTATLKKKGLTTHNAELIAVEIINYSKQYNFNIYDIVEKINGDVKVTDLGQFILNNLYYTGFYTGKVSSVDPNSFVKRSIIK